MSNAECAICAAAGIHTSDELAEIVRDRDRDGLGSEKVYACASCIATGTDDDREAMGLS